MKVWGVLVIVLVGCFSFVVELQVGVGGLGFVVFVVFVCDKLSFFVIVWFIVVNMVCVVCDLVDVVVWEVEWEGVMEEVVWERVICCIEDMLEKDFRDN